jgi:hypothetical protein
VERLAKDERFRLIGIKDDEKSSLTLATGHRDLRVVRAAARLQLPPGVKAINLFIFFDNRTRRKFKALLL